MWALLRVWHVECLDTVIEQATAYSFTRESYVSAPQAWRELPHKQLLARIEQLLIAHYDHRARTSMTETDRARQVPFAYFFEWVERADHPADPTAQADPFVLPQARAHPALVEAAIIELTTRLRAKRKGIDSKCYDDAFTAIRIDENDTWHLVKFADRAPLFAARYGT
jgi:hypothetical protein